MIQPPAHTWVHTHTACLHMHAHTHTVTFTSEAEHSHGDTITCLDASPKLRLFASSSMDSTVRIWTDDNHPVR